MDFETLSGVDPKIRIELSETEAGHLLSILLHAKFSEDVRLPVVASPTTQAILRGLLETREALGWDKAEKPEWRVAGDAIPSFELIERELQHELGRTDVDTELEECLFPFTWIRNGDR